MIPRNNQLWVVWTKANTANDMPLRTTPVFFDSFRLSWREALSPRLTAVFVITGSYLVYSSRKSLKDWLIDLWSCGFDQFLANDQGRFFCIETNTPRSDFHNTIGDIRLLYDPSPKPDRMDLFGCYIPYWHVARLSATTRPLSWMLSRKTFFRSPELILKKRSRRSAIPLRKEEFRANSPVFFSEFSFVNLRASLSILTGILMEMISETFLLRIKSSFSGKRWNSRRFFPGQNLATTWPACLADGVIIAFQGKQSARIDVRSENASMGFYSLRGPTGYTARIGHYKWQDLFGPKEASISSWMSSNAAGTSDSELTALAIITTLPCSRPPQHFLSHSFSFGRKWRPSF